MGIDNGKDKETTMYYIIGSFNFTRAFWRIFLDLGGRSKKNEKRRAARDKIVKLLFYSNRNLDKAHATIESAAENILLADSELDDFRGRDIQLMLDSFVEEMILVNESVMNLTVADFAFFDDWYVEGKLNTVPANGDGGLWFENRSDGLFLCANVSNQGRDKVNVIRFSARLQLPNHENIASKDTRSVPLFNIETGESNSKIVQVRFPYYRKTELSGSRLFIKIRAPYNNGCYAWDNDLRVP